MLKVYLKCSIPETLFVFLYHGKTEDTNNVLWQARFACKGSERTEEEKSWLYFG